MNENISGTKHDVTYLSDDDSRAERCNIRIWCPSTSNHRENILPSDNNRSKLVLFPQFAQSNRGRCSPMFASICRCSPDLQNTTEVTAQEISDAASAFEVACIVMKGNDPTIGEMRRAMEAYDKLSFLCKQGTHGSASSIVDAKGFNGARSSTVRRY